MTYPVSSQPSAPGPASSNRKRILVVAAIVAVVFAIANTVLLIKILGDNDKDDNGGTTAGEETTPGTDDEDPSTDGSEVPGDLQPLDLTITPPDGFSPDVNSYIVEPLYEKHLDYFYLQDGESARQSLFAVSYVMDVDTTDWTEDQKLGKAGELAAAVGDTDTSDSPEVVSETNNFDWIHDYIEAPSNSGTIKYDTFYWFDGPYLIQAACQPEESTDTFHDACVDFIASSIDWNS